MNLTFAGQHREFGADTTYKELYRKRTDLMYVIDTWEARIKTWYLKPMGSLAVSNDNSFAVMLLACVLIDTLSQFEHGKEESDSDCFKSWARELGKGEFKRRITPVIQYLPPGKKNPKKITDCAEALWEGFRCGIVHQAHAPLYCIASDLGDKHDEGAVWLTRESTNEPREYAQYSQQFVNDHGLPNCECHSVMVDPWVLGRLVESKFQKYLGDLRDGKKSHYRKNFKDKFRWCHGIDVG